MVMKSGLIHCKSCSPGKTSVEERACADCEAGKYYSDIVDEDGPCQTCPRGKYSFFGRQWKI